MLCCLCPWNDPASAYNEQAAGGVNHNGSISGYPGQRQFVKTGGNALAAAAPQFEVSNDNTAGQTVCGKCINAIEKVSTR